MDKCDSRLVESRIRITILPTAQQTVASNISESQLILEKIVFVIYKICLLILRRECQEFQTVKCRQEVSLEIRKNRSKSKLMQLLKVVKVVCV